MMKAAYLFCRRGRVWTIVFHDAKGRKLQKSTGFVGPENKAKAEKALERFVARRAAAQAVKTGGATGGPMTVSAWAPLWLQRCQEQGLSSVGDYESRLRIHVLPHIGHLRIDEVTPEHIEEVVARAVGASRTRRHVYDTMHAMFGVATTRVRIGGKVVPALLDRSPCQTNKKDLPEIVDADPLWRQLAVFEREEVQALVYSPLVPWPRRVFWAVSFMAGSRFGETAALHVSDYRAAMQPLAQLVISKSWNSKRGVLKGTKTGAHRLMPVIPDLREILDEWLAGGWPEMMGRDPLPRDILIPTERGTHRNGSTMWRQLNGERDKHGNIVQAGDLDRLGLRPRRQHDARRTFISLARGAGADDSLLKLCTHGRSRAILDVYSEIPWADVCREVAKLKIGRPIGANDGPVSMRNDVLPGCHEVAMVKKTSNPDRLQSDPSGIRIHSPGVDQPRTDADGNGQSRGSADLAPRQFRPGGVEALQNGQLETDGNLATHALRKAVREALESLDRGRVDQAREVLERALARDGRAQAKRAGS